MSEPRFHRALLATLVLSAVALGWAGNQTWSLTGRHYGVEEELPDYVTSAIPFFSVAILVEIVVCWLADLPVYSVADSISSLSAGMFQQMFSVLVWDSVAARLVVYCAVHERYRLVDTALDRIPCYGLTWMLAFLLVDFCYYWFHRMAHEINVLWVAHAAHHSSSRYNLTTALRQAAVADGVSWIFYLPMAFFFSPAVFVVVSQVHLVYQFWVHTQAVRSIGWLEHVLMTPSHHRVHHARNPYAIHMNYGGFLIVWDKLFGTFVPEDQEREPLEFGLKQPWDSFEPVKVQFASLSSVVDRWFKTGRWQSFYRGPAWGSKAHNRPSAAQLPLEKVTELVPDRRMSWCMCVYTSAQMFLSVTGHILAKHFDQEATSPAWLVPWLLLQSLGLLVCCGLHLDAGPAATLTDLFLACSLVSGAGVLFANHSLLLTPPLLAFVVVGSALPLLRLVLGVCGVEFVSRRVYLKPWYFGGRGSTVKAT